jgi:hypothetical protein
MPAEEDENLATEQFGDLNRQFFANEHGPHIYLTHRLFGLVRQASNSEASRAAGAEGLRLGEMVLTIEHDDPVYEKTDAFAALDATVLLHHASESLLRLYISMLDDHPCPWLAISRTRSPGDFKKKVKAAVASLATEEGQRQLSLLLLGHRSHEASVATVTREGGKPVPAEIWDSFVTGGATLIRHAAVVFLEEAPLYNSAKHGLALLAGEASVHYGDADSPIRAQGPSLTYLETITADSGKRQWAQTTRWLSPDQAVAEAQLLVRTIARLWTVAQARYAGIPSESPGLPVEHDLARSVLDRRLSPRTDGGYSITVPSFSMTLLYYEIPSAFVKPPTP